ncbi:MAG: sulfur carrier protein ThiS [Cyanobacteriota bacterium]|jgi:sulfur carrier protein|nr:sulfur carrier protein ThiS [Cyanobacteriota bacterium]
MVNPILNPNSNSIPIQVNGEPKSCPVGTLLPAFLEHLGLNPRLIALEYNGEILHRQLWATTRLHPNDKLEIVTIVGGG